MAVRQFKISVEEIKNNDNGGCIGFFFVCIILIGFFVSKCEDGDDNKSGNQTEISNVNKQEEKPQVYSSEDKTNSSQSITTESNPSPDESQEVSSQTVEEEPKYNTENATSLEDQPIVTQTEEEVSAADEPEHKLSRKERRALRKAQKEAAKRAKVEAEESSL